MQDTNTKSSWGTRHPGLATFQETAVQQLIKPLGQDLHSQVSLESWQKTKFLLKGSSRGKDEHTAEEMKAYLQQAAPVRDFFACRSWDACPTGNWFFSVVWLDTTAVDSHGSCVWPGERCAGQCRFPDCNLCAVTASISLLLFLSTVH